MLSAAFSLAVRLVTVIIASSAIPRPIPAPYVSITDSPKDLNSEVTPSSHKSANFFEDRICWITDFASPYITSHFVNQESPDFGIRQNVTVDKVEIRNRDSMCLVEVYDGIYQIVLEPRHAEFVRQCEGPNQEAVVRRGHFLVDAVMVDESDEAVQNCWRIFRQVYLVFSTLFVAVLQTFFEKRAFLD
jgi:hypothetical protein